MKLYLSSYQVGNHGHDLASLVTGGKRIAVIRNALDFSDDQQRLKDGREREFSALRELGLSPEEIEKLREILEENPSDDLQKLELAVAYLKLFIVENWTGILPPSLYSSTSISPPRPETSEKYAAVVLLSPIFTWKEYEVNGYFVLSAAMVYLYPVLSLSCSIFLDITS